MRRPGHRFIARLSRYAILAAAAAVFVAPLLWLAGATVRPPERFYDYDFFPPPNDLSLQNYRSLFRQIPFGLYLLNSVFVTGVTVVLQLVLSAMGGFALARYRFPGKRLIMLLMLSTLVIPGELLLAPQYQIIQTMGLMDTSAALILPWAVSLLGIFLFRQTMLSIPEELLQSARLDGCGEFGIFWRIALPLVRPMVGVFCLVSFMAAWNAFVWPLIVLHRDEMFTLPLGVSKMLGSYREDHGAMMAGTFLSIIPAVILFFLLQREFIAGLNSGALKS